MHLCCIKPDHSVSTYYWIDAGQLDYSSLGLKSGCLHLKAFHDEILASVLKQKLLQMLRGMKIFAWRILPLTLPLNPK